MKHQIPNIAGRRVIILTGPHVGQEGICLGKADDGLRWMICPDDSNDIIPMVFDQDFGILVTLDN